MKGSSQLSKTCCFSGRRCELQGAHAAFLDHWPPISCIARQKGKVDPDHLSRLGHEASHFELHYSRAMFQRPFRTRKGCFGMGAPGLAR